MEKLPTEIISHILSFLKLSSQQQLATVSPQWREAAEVCLRGRQRLTASDLPRRHHTNETLRALLPRLPGLRTLHLHEELDVDIVSEHCRHLEDVDLSNFRLDTPSVERLCERCPRLSALQLPGHGCESGWLEPLLRRLPGLRVLGVRDTILSAECVALLPAGLERLSLTTCGVAPIPRQPPERWPALRELVLTLAGTGKGSMSSLSALVAGCPGLERLRADCSDVADEFLQVLPSLSKLKHLNLSACTEMTEDGLTGCLGLLKRLQTLNLSLIPSVTDNVLDQLNGSEHLSELTLGVEVYYESVEFTMDALLRLVLSCPSLTSLSLALWEEEPLETLIAGLVRQLGPGRHLTLSVCETILSELNESVLPSGPGPLKLSTFQEEPQETTTMF